MTFEEAFHRLLGHEGGYADHPRDPGGATRWGVTLRVAREHGYTGRMQELPVEFARGVYRKSYWDPVRADELPALVRYAVFDAAVNSGPGQSIKWVQEALGLKQDGVLGSMTLNGMHTVDGDHLLRVIVGIRLMFLAGLPTWPSFGKGWSRRLAAILKD